MGLRMMTALCCGCAIGTTASADPILIYSNTFQTGVVGPEWSANTHAEKATGFTWFAGRYAGNEGIVLTLDTIKLPGGDGVVIPPVDGIDGGGGGGGGGDDDGGDGGGDGGGGGPKYVQYTLTFDIYAIDSWDGSSLEYGPDAFRVVINEGIVFEETIANQHMNQTMREPDVGREQINYGLYDDSIYRDVEIIFTLPAEDETMAIKFRGVGLQAINDESWGIDNVRVSYDIVPAPGAGAIVGAGALMIFRRRRSA